MKKQKRLKQVLIVAWSAFAIFGLCHCGTESTENAVARQKEREKAFQRELNKDNKKIRGVFAGSTPTSDIFLTLENTRSSNGGTVPSSTLAGSLIVSPKISLSLNNQRVQYVFPFSNGIYDATGGDNSSDAVGVLAFDLEKDTRASNVSCTVDRENNLNCIWNVNSNTVFSLKPTKVAALSILSAPSTADYVYTGGDKTDNVMIEFESDPVSKDGSRIPDPTIAGALTFFEKEPGKSLPTPGKVDNRVYGFRAGTYDIIRGIITVTIDLDVKTIMACTIVKKGAALDCRYHGRNPRQFYLFRTIRQ